MGRPQSARRIASLPNLPTRSIHSFANRLGLAWRNLAAVAWLPFYEPAQDKTSLFRHDAPARELAEAYLTLYRLDDLHRIASRTRYRETLALLEWLEVFHGMEPDLTRQGDPLKWLDAGAGSWSYVGALHAFLSRHLGDRPFGLDGVELDAGRRYTSLRTRGQAGRAYADPFSNARYHAGDIMAWQAPAHIISQFLPFVLEDPHLAWGLPLNHFKPEAVLRHLLERLEPEGFLLIVNQGEAEAEAQEALLKTVAAGVPMGYKQTGRLPDTFVHYRYPRYGWICRKAP